jgi:hypothetical protein
MKYSLLSSVLYVSNRRDLLSFFSVSKEIFNNFYDTKLLSSHLSWKFLDLTFLFKERIVIHETILNNGKDEDESNSRYHIDENALVSLFNKLHSNNKNNLFLDCLIFPKIGICDYDADLLCSTLFASESTDQNKLNIFLKDCFKNILHSIFFSSYTIDSSFFLFPIHLQIQIFLYKNMNHLHLIFILHS